MRQDGSSKRSATRALTGVLSAAGALIAGVGVLWWQQERIVFQPPRWRDVDELGAMPDVERVSYRADDGQPLLAYVVRPTGHDAALASVPASVPASVLIAFHGNAELAQWTVPWAREVARRTGLTVLVPEYRGYAGLPGRPTYDGSRLDARAAHRVAVERLGAAPDHIRLFGHSLGSAIAAELAAHAPPRALVLQSPFTSARAMARLFTSPRADQWWERIARVHYDTETRTAELDAPVWVAHGDRDLVIPVQMGRRVHETARTRGELLLIPGAGHNDVALVGGERYWRWLERAVR
jgi:pimeloyl-ACP methyl ester carboxylesterase